MQKSGGRGVPGAAAAAPMTRAPSLRFSGHGSPAPPRPAEDDGGLGLALGKSPEHPPPAGVSCKLARVSPGRHLAGGAELKPTQAPPRGCMIPDGGVRGTEREDLSQ